MKTFITYLEDYKPSLRINIQQMELPFRLDYHIIYYDGNLWRLQWKSMDVITRIVKNTMQSGVLHRITDMDTWKTHVIFSQTTTTWYERTNMVTTDSMEFL